MADAIKVFFLILSALFPIVDPLSGSPIFLALTRDICRRHAGNCRCASRWTAFF